MYCWVQVVVAVAVHVQVKPIFPVGPGTEQAVFDHELVCAATPPDAGKKPCTT
jgi:hypothetical protein